MGYKLKVDKKYGTCLQLFELKCELFISRYKELINLIIICNEKEESDIVQTTHNRKLINEIKNIQNTKQIY